MSSEKSYVKKILNIKNLIRELAESVESSPDCSPIEQQYLSDMLNLSELFAQSISKHENNSFLQNNSSDLLLQSEILIPDTTDSVLESTKVIYFTFQNSSHPFKLPMSLIDRFPDSYFYNLSHDPDLLDNGPLYIDYDDTIGRLCCSLLLDPEFPVNIFTSQVLKQLVACFQFLCISLPPQFDTLKCFQRDLPLPYEKESPLVIFINNQINTQIIDYWKSTNSIPDFLRLYNNGCIPYNYKDNIYTLTISNPMVSLVEEYIQNNKQITNCTLPKSIDKYTIKQYISLLLPVSDSLHVYKLLWDQLSSSIILNKNTLFINLLYEWLGVTKEWKLLYRASEHNFSLKEFHRYCDKQGETVTLIKQIGHHNCINIFGGYTNIEWDSGNYGWRQDKTAFLFTLQNEHSYPPTKFSMIAEDTNIYNCSERGPHFGDIGIYDDCHTSPTCCCDKRYYTHNQTPFKASLFVNTNDINERNYFCVDDYEVYRIA
ncbi:hypothetical protein WA158_003856 [Blastocystis sp. Blastoise]